MNQYDLDIDLQTSEKVTVHPLANWTKGKEDMLRTRIFI